MPALTDQAFAIYNPDTGQSETPMQRIESMLEFVNKVPGFHKLDMYQKRLIILERYLTKYLDFDWTSEDPLSKLLSATPKEDYRTNSRTNLRHDQFLANEIKDTFGYNLTEFLTLPTYYMEDLLAKQRKALKERRETIERQKREAARQSNGMIPPEFMNGLHNFNSG
jgi:hypothetical protein